MKHLSDDENVKMMRDTARAVGLTQLLIDLQQSPDVQSIVNSERLLAALKLLGVTL